MTNLIETVRESYAYNSRLYDYMENKADLSQIVKFLTWDAEQPAFSVYLHQWLDKLPINLRLELIKHIDEEESEDHSGMFKQMLEALREQVGDVKVSIDQEQIDRLNYVFSETSVQEQGVGFFLGSFLATEFMSQKRCQQLLSGLCRLGVQSDTEYLVLHAETDEHHWIEVDKKLVEPAITNGFVSVDSVLVGINHRLYSSANFLKYYENQYLF